MKDFNEIVNGQTPVIVDFFAEWCGPCKMMSPILSNLKRSVGDKAIILKVDVDKNPELAGAFQVRGVPTLMLFSKGQVRWRQSGVVPADHLARVIETYA